MKFRNILVVFLLISMVLPMFMFSVTAKEITITANGINITRESGSLVIYTPDNGATTGTNEWGYEVIIEENVAVKYNKGNSSIPKNGFVLSGHNEDEGGKRMGDWIQENIKIGDYVNYTGDGVVTVSDTPITVSAFYTLTTALTGVNSVRYENNMIVYNKLGKSTETNDWGLEVVCTEGVVSSIGGNNNTVPNKQGSFVVSGHGTAVTWIRENVKLGMSVKYDEAKKTISFSYDDSAVIMGMELDIDNLWKEYDAAVKRYDNFNYASVKNAIEELENAVSTAKVDYRSSKDDMKLVEARDKAEKTAIDIRLQMSESRTAEYRGVWLRPTETSATKVDETVEKLYNLGINMISIETIYDCTMIMPMPDDSLFDTNPKFAHFDMLQAYIDSCHKRGMELHLWFPIFYVGNTGSANKNRSLGVKKPEWLSLSSNGKTIEDTEGYYMLDPANEDARNYLLNTYKYILEKYDVDGFQLDYIRYFTRTADFDMGYNEATLDAFEAKYGVRPKYDTKASYWNDWVNFRCGYVDSFVLQMRKLIDDVAPGVLLGADVVPDPSESVSHNYQNYYTWLENKWIDILFPMSYGTGFDEAIVAQTNRCGEDAYIAVGLGTFMTEFGADTMQSQASYNTSVYTDGSVYFEATAYINKEVGEHLANGVYRNKAIAPAFDIKATAKAQIEYMKDRIKNVIIPLDGVAEAEGNKIISAADAFLTTLTDDGYGTNEYDAVLSAIKNSNADKVAIERMTKDLSLAVKGYKVKGKTVDTSNVPEVPDVSDILDTSESEEDKSSSGSDENSSENSSSENNTSDKSDSSDSKNENSKDDSSNDGKSKVLPIILGIVGALAAVSAGIFVFLKKKKA
ncbi:MAG: family 10 glycosylhydrolase [Clostridia bacterium]|nr:family 10 glycosylhydrolase [Clostridia bacterium]